MLEGGYNTRAGWLSPLSQSVAAHVRALCSSGITRIAGFGPLSDDQAAVATAYESMHEEVGEEEHPSLKRRRLEEDEAELFGTPAGVEEHFPF